GSGDRARRSGLRPGRRRARRRLAYHLRGTGRSEDAGVGARCRMTTTAFVEAAAKAHKLWGGRFKGAGTAPQFDALNNSIGVDIRLWPFDVELSKAWAMALYGAGVLTIGECNEIERGLDAVGQRLAAGVQSTASDEDVHTL